MKETTMNINKEEQQFIAENITRYDVVTDITVDDIEIRIHGKAHGGTGSTALYRIADVADIYAHVEEKCKEAIADCASRPWPADGVWNDYLRRVEEDEVIAQAYASTKRRNKDEG